MSQTTYYNDDIKEKLEKILYSNRVKKDEILKNENYINNIISDYKKILNCSTKTPETCDSLFRVLKEQLINSYNMVKNQFIQKSKDFKDDLSSTIDLIQINISKERTINIEEKKKLKQEKLKLISEEITNNHNIINEEISKFFNLFFNKVNVQLAEFEKDDYNIANLKQEAQKIYDTYEKEFKNMKRKVETQIDIYKKKLNSILKQSTEDEDIIFEENFDNFSLGLLQMIEMIFSIPFSALGAIASFFISIKGLIEKIYKYFKSKETLKKELEDFYLFLASQKKNIIDKTMDCLIKIDSEYRNRINNLYETIIISNFINKDKFKEIYKNLKEVMKNNKKN